MAGFIHQAPPLQVPSSDVISYTGLYFLLGNIGLTVITACLIFIGRWYKSKGKLDARIRGRIRFAATTGKAWVLQGLKRHCGNAFDVESSNTGFTALQAASIQGQASTVLWLCQNGARVNATKDDGWGYSSLHFAAARGHFVSCKILVAFGADTRMKNFQGLTAAELASHHGKKQVAAFLSDPSSPSYTMLDPLVYKGKRYVFQDDEWLLLKGEVEEEGDIKEWLEPDFYGYGTEGTVSPPRWYIYRCLAVLAQTCAAAYLIWRALRSMNQGARFVYSAIFWECEFIMYIVGFVFYMSLWYRIERPARRLDNMLEESDFPDVEVMIPTYSEPVDIVEATVVAALNMDYPGHKLNVCVLDDGGRTELRDHVKKMQVQLKYMERACTLRYVERTKVNGINHHAKAGNINSCLMLESSPKEYIVVLDADMIVDPMFLLRTLGHMYMSTDLGAWKKKTFASLVQTPQDFWNVDPKDPLVNCARFFYGPMLQGRDGIGSCPCVGTGVLFQRNALLSIGGQPTTSITEDYFTAMHLISSSFGTMYLNERLTYGMAPSDIISLFEQRLRWAIGALQIMFLDNPLTKPGLNLAQSFLFWEAAFQYFLSYGTVLFCVSPIIYIFSGLAPMLLERLWEFCIAFLVYYLSNRLVLWYAHKDVLGGPLELWRGSQVWVWLSMNQIKATIKVILWQIRLVPKITFKVTRKDQMHKGPSRISFLRVLWPLILYYISLVAATVFFIANWALGSYSSAGIVVGLTSIGWGIVIGLYIWPPVSTLLPRRESSQGWQIAWKVSIDSNRFHVDSRNRLRKVLRRILSNNTTASRQSVLKDEVEIGNISLSKIEAHFSPGNYKKLETETALSPFEMIGIQPLQLKRGSCDSQNSNLQGDSHSINRELSDFLSPFEEDLADGESNDSIVSDHALHNHSMLSGHAKQNSGHLRSPLNSTVGKIAMPSKDISYLHSWNPYTSIILPEPEIVGRVPIRVASLQQSIMHIPVLELKINPHHSDPSLGIERTRQQGLTRHSSLQLGDLRQRGDSYQRPVFTSFLSRTSIESNFRDIESQISNIAPNLPENEFDYNIVAKSSFEHRHTPASSYMFLLVNILVFVALIIGAVLYISE